MKDEEIKILELYGSLPHKELAKRLRISRGKLRRIAKKLKLWKVPESRWEIGGVINIEELEENYQIKTQQELARHYGVSITQIKRVLKKNNIYKKKRQKQKKGIFKKPAGWNPITNSIDIETYE